MKYDTFARRWMVVDDTPAVLEAVSMLLESLNCAEICRFDSANEALEAFLANPNAYEIIITDLDMPEMNGIELCEMIHAVAPTQSVLLATGSSEITEREAASQGFCGMLRKPFPVRELLKQLERAGVETRSDAHHISFIQEARASVAMFSSVWA
jgi:CheY-like chemotaxis protein